MRFPWQKKPNPKTKLFEDYAKEQFEELTHEHRVVSNALSDLVSGRARGIIGGVGQDVRAQVHTNLLARKLELELMINTLK